MTGDSTVLGTLERERLAAQLRGWDTSDYVAVRAIAALSDDAAERIGRFTAMGRQFVAEIRDRVRERGAGFVLDEPASAHERVLESATDQIVQPGSGELSMLTLAAEAGLARRSLYNMYASAPELVEACRRRGQTIWRARFEQRVLAAAVDPQARLFALVDELHAWVGSDRFRRDQALSARPSFAPELREDDLRDHLREVERFAMRLAIDAEVRASRELAAFVTTMIAGAAAWFDRRDVARATSIASVERFVARARP